MAEAKFMNVFIGDYTTSLAGRNRSVVFTGQTKDELKNICKKNGFYEKKNAEKKVGERLIYKNLTWFLWDNDNVDTSYNTLLERCSYLAKFERAIERRRGDITNG